MTIRRQGSGPVVLVDDDELDIEVLRRCFDRSRLSEHCVMRSFISGQLFFEYVNTVQTTDEPFPSILLLDINMPLMDGFEVLERLRAIPAFEQVPRVTFVSNSDREEDIQRVHRYGATFREKFSSVSDGIAFFNSLLD